MRSKRGYTFAYVIQLFGRDTGPARKTDTNCLHRFAGFFQFVGSIFASVNVYLTWMSGSGRALKLARYSTTNRVFQTPNVL